MSLYDTRMWPRGAANLNLQFDTSLPKWTLGVFQRYSSVLIFNLQNGKSTGVDYPLSLSIWKVDLSLYLHLQHIKIGDILAWMMSHLETKIT